VAPSAQRSYLAEPFSYSEARALVADLGLSEPTAITLVRRGYRTVEDARRFLEASESHDPFELAGMEEAVARTRAAIEAGQRITVHGDYDVDGVCSTALLVEALRGLGADCDWFIPDRMADGYGLSTETVELLAARDSRLLITVDCGIGSAVEVEAAKKLGLDVIVTDHHSPPPQLPACTVVHPALGDYPFAELCGTGVAHKLSAALQPGGGADGELDLVALATVADMVPLTGENRSLVRRGLAVARRAHRPGLRALIAASGADAARLDEGDIAFRLAPRINAAGRLYRADAGVELLLTADGQRATAIAEELNRANHERRETERAVEGEADAALGELPAELREAPAIVLAGEGWHPGVVGIVASRLVERHWRPVVLISIDAGRGRGSGRSIPGFDLLGGLEACAAHLEKFGGHRAAAGLEIRADRVADFREAFIAHTAAELGPAELTRTDRVDAVVGGGGLGLDLAEELDRLAPFGMGNPGVRLLVPSARVGDVQPMGEGKHARFSLQSGDRRALGVCFGRSSLPVGADEPIDASVRLEINEWNGAIEPRVVLGELYSLSRNGDPAGGGHSCSCKAEEWWARFKAELEAPLEPWPSQRQRTAGNEPRETVRSTSSPSAILAELVSSGEPVLALCADASRRSGMAGGAAGLARFAGGRAALGCGRCPAEAVARALRPTGAGLVLADYAALALAPDAAAGFTHVVLVDPPAFPHEQELASRRGGEPGYLHPAWGTAEVGFASRILGHTYAVQPALRGLYRKLREARELSGEELRRALSGGGPHPRSAEQAARCARILLELELVSGSVNGSARSLRPVSSEGTELERSAAFRAYRARHEEGKQYLERQRQT
jgi:single-stranded-DNA-specific exonuclease